jgi:DNA modification methylase
VERLSSAALLPRSDQGLRLPGTVTATSLELPEAMPFEEWEEVGRTLDRIRESVHWWRGDWLCYGERTYGEMYAQALDPEGTNYQSLLADVWVAKQVGLLRRRNNLSWSHHREIASLGPEEQTRFLEGAAEQGWSTRELRERVREHKQLPPPVPRAPEVKIPEDQWQSILERVEAGETQASIAGAYGVSEARISGIVQTQRAAVRRAAARVKAQQDGRKSHEEAHGERMAASRERQSGRAALPDMAELPFDRVVYGADALTYLKALPDACVDVCVTSPPYWKKRTYVPGEPLELGQEATPEDYVANLGVVLVEVGRVLKEDGCLFLNLGDTLASQPGQYRGDPDRARGISEVAVRANGTAGASREFDVPDKSFCLIPERIVSVLVRGLKWRLSGKIVWHKLGHAPENVHDRLTQAWEPIYVLTRAEHAYFDRRPSRDDVWRIAVGQRGGAKGHLAPFPEELVERAIRHGCREAGVVLDPFAGSGTTLRVARRMGRRFLGCDLVAVDA